MRRSAAVEKKDPEIALAEAVSDYYADPLGFVSFAWPWGVKGGPLENLRGPDRNQAQFLDDLGKLVSDRGFDGHNPVDPIRMSISSANGTGKTVLGAWITWWILSTRKQSVGTVTAGTYDQLEQRVWADIMHWGRMCATSHWFDIQASGIFSRDPKEREKWKVTPKTSAPGREQTFAGQHAASSTSWAMMDEASEVVPGVWSILPTCMTDGEPMFFAWGQMMRNSGPFYDACFGAQSTRWNTRVWDGRDSAFTSQDTIRGWLEEYGEDSDYYRVHVLGLPPRASELQFIGQDLIDGARRREHTPLEDEPLVWGYDAANGGLARHVFWGRRGLDAKSIAPIWLPGDTPRDAVVAKALELMSDKRPGRRAAAMFGDQAFGSVILERVRNLGYTNVFEVNFGSPSPDKRYLNTRAMLWARMKEWLNLGAIADDPKVYQGFMDPGFHHRSGKLVLESKQDMQKRRVKSPDFPDALATTFFHAVAPVVQQQYVPQMAREYSPYSWMA